MPTLPYRQSKVPSPDWQVTKMTAAIVIDRLTKNYGQQIVVNNLTMTVEKGEIFGFLGPNGSGKTTTIKMLCGLVQPTSGTATVNGFDILKESDQVRHSIGYMSQQFSLYKNLTVEQNIDFYAELYGLDRGKALKRKKDVLDITGLIGQETKKAVSLSGGWKQRLALACAIVHEPPIIFLDEPTAGIDPVARRALWDLLFSLATTGITFFVTTHYMDEAERCNSVGYIFQSNLIALGKVDELSLLPTISDGRHKHLEVACNKVMPTFQYLRSHQSVNDVTIFGRTLHLVVPNDLSKEKLWEELKAQDFGVSEIREIKPSLEDVFVTLTEHEEARVGLKGNLKQ
jgi:ABC-type multidrug transport system ATPase subunit